MTPYSCMSREELEREYGSVLASYEACKAQGLKLNMARGKPATEQLDMVSGLFLGRRNVLQNGIEQRL